jgi:hypothetical protein
MHHGGLIAAKQRDLRSFAGTHSPYRPHDIFAWRLRRLRLWTGGVGIIGIILIIVVVLVLLGRI